MLVLSPLSAAHRAAQLQGLHFYAVVTAAAMKPRMELLAHVVDASATLTAIDNKVNIVPRPTARPDPSLSAQHGAVQLRGLHLLHGGDRGGDAAAHGAQGARGGRARDPDRHRRHPAPGALPDRAVRLRLPHAVPGTHRSLQVL